MARKRYLIIGDGAAFAAEHTDAFDAIIVDGSDPVGPAVVLFSGDFFAACRREFFYEF